MLYDYSYVCVCVCVSTLTHVCMNLQACLKSIGKFQVPF